MNPRDAIARLLERGRIRKALERADEAVAEDPSDPELHYLRGLALTQLGRVGDADAAFAEAQRLDPENYFAPFRLEAEAFDRHVEKALRSLPKKFRDYLENVEIAVEEVPDRKLLREGLEFDLLGLYQGGTIQSESWGFPDRILLFQRNLENVSPDRETLVREIRDTLLHEVGHHLGMDEERLQELEEE